jgi:hypothetical protein
MKELKSVKKNQILTKTEKIEAQKYNSELYALTGLRFKCLTIRDYYLIKILWTLLAIVQDPIVLEYYEALLEEYYGMLEIKSVRLKKKVIDKTVEGFYFNYGYTEGLYQYWLKYYYPTCLNFVSFLALYSGEELPYTVFENTTKTALNKLCRFIEEQSIEMIRAEMSNIEEITTELREAINDYKKGKIDINTLEDRINVILNTSDDINTETRLGDSTNITDKSVIEDLEDEFKLNIYFIWRATNDRVTCKVCNRLNGKRYKWAPGLAHPNCRCRLEVRIEER